MDNRKKSLYKKRSTRNKNARMRSTQSRSSSKKRQLAVARQKRLIRRILIGAACTLGVVVALILVFLFAGKLADSSANEGGNSEGVGSMTDVSNVTHLSFSMLLADETLTDSYPGTITVTQFNQILQNLYDHDYVLVDYYSIANVETDKDGNMVFRAAEVEVPAGKKALVISERDVSYPFDKIGSGFPSKLMLDANGNIVNELVRSDGTVVTGAFDVIPCVEQFVMSHPDFSVNGARGLVGLTGYNGILGYRTTSYLGLTDGNPYSYYGVFDTIFETEQCKTVLNALTAAGWHMASYSNKLTSYGSEYSMFQSDVDDWQTNVGSVVGICDILIYPYGTDIASWSGYSDTNAKYIYLKNQGFNYFCAEDSENATWLQANGTYVRQGMHVIDNYSDYEYFQIKFM